MATKTPKNPRLPLSKTSREAFERRYQELFLREADANVSDEVLMKFVNDYETQKNPNSEDGKEQEGIQTNEGNGKSEEQLREEAVKRFIDVAGVNPDESLTTEEIIAGSLTLENRKFGSKEYFDLFGTQPTESMTNEQIFNAIDVKKSELAQAEKPKGKPKAEFVLEEGQVLATHKVTGEEKVFNVRTLKYLTDWEETPIAPKEIQK